MCLQLIASCKRERTYTVGTCNLVRKRDGRFIPDFKSVATPRFLNVPAACRSGVRLRVVVRCVYDLCVLLVSVVHVYAPAESSNSHAAFAAVAAAAAAAASLHVAMAQWRPRSNNTKR